MCRTLYLALYTWFTCTHSSRLSRSLWMAFLLSSVSTAPHSSVSSAYLHSIPIYITDEVLNTISANRDLWATPLVADLHLDIEMFADCNILDVAFQPISYPPNSPPIKPISFQFSDKDVVSLNEPEGCKCNVQRLLGAFHLIILNVTCCFIF